MAQLFFDAEELVVFGDAIGAGGGAGFDLAGARAYGEIGDEGVFGFAAAVANDERCSRSDGRVRWLRGLEYDGADLVDFNES